jgi:hypothetical protein
VRAALQVLPAMWSQAYEGASVFVHWPNGSTCGWRDVADEPVLCRSGPAPLPPPQTSVHHGMLRTPQQFPAGPAGPSEQHWKPLSLARESGLGLTPPSARCIMFTAR